MPDSLSEPTAVSRQRCLSLVALTILTALPYLSGLRHEFVYDDHGQIVENHFLERGDSWKRVLTLDTLNDGAVVNGRRPLVLATYLADRAMWGLNPVGWRVSNLLWHVACVLALYLFVRRVAARPNNTFAFCSALLFAWHPVLIEAVHVPSFRPDVLYTLCALLMLHAALSGRVLAALVCFWLALMAKEAGVVAPFLVGVCWILFPATRSTRRTTGLILGASVVLFVLYAALCMRGESPGSLQAVGSDWNGRSLLFPDNLRSMPWLWVTYLRILVWPYPLIVDRVIDPVSAPGTIAGVVAISLAVALAFIVHRKAAWISFGVAVMFLGFAPVSNLVPLLNPVAERYLYLMTAGWAMILAWPIAGRGFRSGSGTEWRKAALGVLVVVYLVLGLCRMPDFRDDRTLWARTLRAEPRSARAHTWIGLDLKRQEHWQEALDHFDRARALNPRDVAPLVNSAIIHGQLGDLDSAVRLLRDALAIRPTHATTHWNLAIALQKQGRYEEALDALAELTRIDPMHARARKARIALWADLNRPDEALREAEQLLRYWPDDPEARAARDSLEQFMGNMPP